MSDGFHTLGTGPKPAGKWTARWQKLLFKLHLRSSYPTYMTGLDGSKVPCNVIRTDMESFDIKQGPFIKTGDNSRLVNGHINVYTPPGES